MSAPAISPPDKSRPDHLHPGDETLAQYASISRTAILALALGLVSALVLVSPILVVVPLAAIAAAVVALRQIATSQGQLLGAWPATVGLCLATMFLGWGLSRQITREAVLAREAQEFAEGWLILVQEGKLQRADQMRRPPSSRLNSDPAIAEYYATDKEAGEGMQSIFADEPLKSFAAAGPAATFQFEGITGHTQHGFSDYVALEYSLGPAADGSVRKPLWITVQRTAAGSIGSAGWQISRADGELPPPR